MKKIKTRFNLNKLQFSRRLKKEIKAKNLTYNKAAELILARLPPGSKFSEVSLWNYAAGKSLPRRVDVFEALCEEFHLDTGDDEIDIVFDDAMTAEGNAFELVKFPEGFFMKGSGEGLAFIRFAAKVEWDKALEIARILLGDNAVRRTA